jgi:hypothetical protein
MQRLREPKKWLSKFHRTGKFWNWDLNQVSQTPKPELFEACFGMPCKVFTVRNFSRAPMASREILRLCVLPNHGLPAPTLRVTPGYSWPAVFALLQSRKQQSLSREGSSISFSEERRALVSGKQTKTTQRHPRSLRVCLLPVLAQQKKLSRSCL